MRREDSVHKIIWLLAVAIFATFSVVLFFAREIFFVRSHISPIRWAAATFVPIFVAADGLRKKHLTKSGAFLGIILAFVCTLASWSYLMALMAFFLAGSKATKFRANEKRKIEGEDFKDGGQRDWVQVLCNGGPALQFALLHCLAVGVGTDYPVDFSGFPLASNLGMAYMGALACCSGDTWASELGSVLSSTGPVLITTLRPVPRGTNGAVSAAGNAASIAGGAVVGLGYCTGTWIGCYGTYHALGWEAMARVVCVGALCGLHGNLLDSLLGATLQYSGYDEEKKTVVQSGGKHISGFALLDNHAVNLLSSVITGLVAPTIAVAVLPPTAETVAQW